MANSIKDFVETLKSEGVDAGKEAAQKIEAEARTQAEQIIVEAKAKADQLVADADAEAEQVRRRMNSSLELATRDAILLLRQKLSDALSTVLSHEIDQALSEEETLNRLLRDVIPACTKLSLQNKANAEIRLPKDMHSRLLNGTLRELTRALKGRDIHLNVKASLEKAGFEYKIDGSTVEVSVESVTALLSDMIDPELRRILEKVTEQQEHHVKQDQHA